MIHQDLGKLLITDIGQSRLLGGDNYKEARNLGKRDISSLPGFLIEIFSGKTGRILKKDYNMGKNVSCCRL
jgi:hypothetical protein